MNLQSLYHGKTGLSLTVTLILMLSEAMIDNCILPFWQHYEEDQHFYFWPTLFQLAAITA